MPEITKVQYDQIEVEIIKLQAARDSVQLLTVYDKLSKMAKEIGAPNILSDFLKKLLPVINKVPAGTFGISDLVMKDIRSLISDLKKNKIKEDFPEEYKILQKNLTELNDKLNNFQEKNREFKAMPKLKSMMRAIVPPTALLTIGAVGLSSVLFNVIGSLAPVAVVCAAVATTAHNVYLVKKALACEKKTLDTEQESINDTVLLTYGVINNFIDKFKSCGHIDNMRQIEQIRDQLSEVLSTTDLDAKLRTIDAAKKLINQTFNQYVSDQPRNYIVRTGSSGVSKLCLTEGNRDGKLLDPRRSAPPSP